MRYKVEKRGDGPWSSDWYVIGLVNKDGSWDSEKQGWVEAPDTLLIVRTDYGEVDSPSTGIKMHQALYDMFQWHEGLKEGDEFETEFGMFYCRSFHVLNEEEVKDWDERNGQ